MLLRVCSDANPNQTTVTAEVSVETLFRFMKDQTTKSGLKMFKTDILIITWCR